MREVLSSLNRKERIEVAKETLHISERGSYVAVDGVEVKFDPTPQTEFWSTRAFCIPGSQVAAAAFWVTISTTCQAHCRQ